MKKRKRLNRDLATAYHEAGRAVAAYYQGVALKRATIVSGTDEGGYPYDGLTGPQ